jgi:chorismate mutase/prephenate dehydratase
VVSTTKAAERAAQEPGSAAIGQDDAAKRYDLKIIASDIQDNPNNMTRFVVIAKPEHAAQRTGDDKTTVMFGVKDRPGALYDCLLPFHKANVNLCRIESRPSRRRPWEYLFFIDLSGHQTDVHVRNTLAELGKHTSTLEVLGSYPRADQPLNE